MGHRALVAYRRPDRLYDLRYSHWGGEDLSLVDRVRPDAPLADGAVAPELLADSIARERILEEFLDPGVYEAVYFVLPEKTYAVEAFRLLRLDWDDGRDGSRGALVAVEPGPADRTLRVWSRATRTVLADVVDIGGLSRPAAEAYLEARVCEDHDGRPYTYVADRSAHEPPPDRVGENGSGDKSA